MTSLSADLWRWLALAGAAIAILAFEWHQRRRQTARQRHVTMRERWLDALMARPGQEIVAVQTLRNSLMAASIVASTTVIAIMGTISLVGPVAAHLALRLTESPEEAAVRPVQLAIGALLVIVLFTAFLFATQSARFYNHLSYLVGFGAAATDDDRVTARHYVALAGRYYSDSLRTMVYLAPLVVGLFEPLAVLPGALAVILVLAYFDRRHPSA